MWCVVCLWACLVETLNSLFDIVEYAMTDCGIQMCCGFPECLVHLQLLRSHMVYLLWECYLFCSATEEGPFEAEMSYINKYTM